MNIFKILANGHGTVNENNISAFLGYLLDPNENHSLDYEFLIQFLGEILEEKEKYEFKIFFEQEFREEKNTKKEVVDIVIVCYQTNISNKKKTSVKDFIQNKKKIEKIILIENKINSGSKNIGQLKRQYKSTIDELKKIEKNIENIDIHSIYVTPDNSKFVAEFESFKKEVNVNATHIVWKKNNKSLIEEKTSIKEILENILLLENQAKIDPINEYTKHTLKSFIQFIETDFKSEKEVKKEGLYQKDIHQTIKSLLEKYSNLVDDKLIDSLYQFETYIETHPNPKITYRCSKTHLISVSYNGKKVFSLTKRSKKVIYHLILRGFKTLQNNDSVLKNYCEINKFKLVSHIDNKIKQGSEYKPHTFEIKEIIALFEKIISFIK